ncbi:hypothetical protein SDC9_110814 [bioreactor metagenome]|uniref:Uncharacterized protein n=1 Tax=bioreactor metagenome TaxID=1076179 RepID=A0A645BEQ5_9ZZZZ
MDGLILLLDNTNVAGPENANGALAADEQVLDVVSGVREDQGLLLNELLLGGIKLVKIRRVQGIPEQLEGNADGVALGVHHENLLLILGVPQDAPGVDGVADKLRAVGETHGSPHIRNRVFAFGVIAKPVEFWVDAGGVWHIGKVDIGQHVFCFHLGDHIVGRNDDVVGIAGRVFNFEVHILVGLKGIIYDLDSGFLLELLHNAGCDVVAPVIDLDDFVAFAAGTAGKKQR